MATSFQKETFRNLTIRGFGLFDDRQREIGAYIRRVDLEVTQEYQPGSVKSWLPAEYPFQRVFQVFIQTTRDGVCFGASQNTVEFESTTDREAYIERRIKDGTKAAQKKHDAAQAARAAIPASEKNEWEMTERQQIDTCWTPEENTDAWKARDAAAIAAHGAKLRAR